MQCCEYSKCVSKNEIWNRCEYQFNAKIWKLWKTWKYKNL